MTRFRVQPSYNSSALPNFVLDGNGEWVAYQDAMQAIATARAEAIREAAEKMKLKAYRTIINCRPSCVVNYDDVTAILSDKQESTDADS